MAPTLSPHKAYYRFVVLFFNCLLTFGSYFCFDMPSVLQDQFQANTSCPQNSSAHANGSASCVEGLGMSPQQYNLLYAIYAWTNAVVVIAAGFLIDKLGNRVGVFLFSLLCVLGSATFALGSHFGGTGYMLPIMLGGRLLFGSGNGSLTIVQNRITAFWFKGKELALAFGLTLAFSRLGSVLNFFLTQRAEAQFGLQWTLWGGALLCALGFVAAVVVSVLDRVGTRQLGLEGSVRQESKRVQVHPGQVRGLLAAAGGVRGGCRLRQLPRPLRHGRHPHRLRGAARRVLHGVRGAHPAGVRAARLHHGAAPRVHALARSHLLVRRGQHVAVHPAGGPAGHAGYSHGSHHLHSDDRHRLVQRHCGTDPRHQVQRSDDPAGALAVHDDLHACQHRVLHRRIALPQRRGQQTGRDSEQEHQAAGGWRGHRRRRRHGGGSPHGAVAAAGGAGRRRRRQRRQIDSRVCRTHAHTHTHVYTHTHTRVYTHTHTCIHTHTHVYTHTHAHMRAHTHAHTRTHTSTHTCIHARTRAHTHAHTRVYARTHTHVYTHAHTRTRTHTRTHTRTRTHACVYTHTKIPPV
ncbi:uncharacterized protein LOC116954658 isoform X1 [Petromyzon marinus]|uniref:uncharacterized protein LOC116954658 isoform X1 n=1 Tax=Petromyzon marinus TaxID=7757 RepID=UPI003F6FE4D5